MSPDTVAGMWSMSLAGTAFAATAAVAALLSGGVEPADSLSDNWALTTIGAITLITGVAAVASGVFAFALRGERSASVLAAIVVGGLLMALMLQQGAEGLGWLEA